ncbi:hypothetical protein GGI21_001845 [Coemansia aciculifera]|nr:hypothetical protein GGI21_001845 [Coemansia aciculifera]
MASKFCLDWVAYHQNEIAPATPPAGFSAPVNDDEDDAADDQLIDISGVEHHFTSATPEHLHHFATTSADSHQHHPRTTAIAAKVTTLFPVSAPSDSF